MITEDYVSFEIAKQLKEKGFKGQGEHFYENGKIIGYINYWNRITPKQRYEAIEAPTLQMAMKWLREACGLTISIEFQAICPTWKWRIYINSSNKKHTDFQHYNKYEESVDAALKYALKNLI